MNNLQQRRQMQNQQLMRQGQNMLTQQNQDWYNVGQSIGNTFFPNIAGGSQDGKYGDIDLTKLDGYDKSLNDKQNYSNTFGNPELSGVGNDYLNNNGTYAQSFTEANPEYGGVADAETSNEDNGLGPFSSLLDGGLIGLVSPQWRNNVQKYGSNIAVNPWTSKWLKK